MIAELNDASATKAPEVLFAVPAGDWDEFTRQPESVRDDVYRLFAAFRVLHTAKKVKRACEALAYDFGGRRGFSAARIRSKYYEYIRTADWRCLADKARAPKLAQRDDVIGLPDEFVNKELRRRFGKNKRKNLPAIRQLKEEFATGVSIKGYGTWREWFAKEFPHLPLPAIFPGTFPKGWSDGNLQRYKPTKAQEKLAREGISAALKHLPCVRGTRAGLRFLEEVQFDDVKTDFRVVDPESRQVCDLWLLIARDRATDLILGYGMRPALAREDGSQEHLKQTDMKQLSGWVLQKYGLPPYRCLWRVENGTATFPDATAQVIAQLSGGRLTVSFASMIGGTVMPGGFKDRAVGNSRAKAGLESGNNLIHNESANLPGQTGPTYQRRPAELAAREAECRELFKLANTLSKPLYDQIEFPLLTIHQARAELNRIFHAINSRTWHALEDFEDVVIWRDSEADQWQPVSTMPPGHVPAITDTRKESPYERMARLIQGVTFSPVHPSFFTHFFDATHRIVRVLETGEIEFDTLGKTHVFMPSFHGQFKAGEKYLAYHHAHELDLLHLTQLPPHGGYVATIARKPKVRAHDPAATERALQYTKGAFNAQLSELRSWHADEQVAHDSRKAHNAGLQLEQQSSDGAIDVGMIPCVAAPGEAVATPVNPPALKAIEFIRTQSEQAKVAAKVEAKEEEDLHAMGIAALKSKLNTGGYNGSTDEY